MLLALCLSSCPCCTLSLPLSLSLFVVLPLFHSMTSFVMVLVKFWQLVHCILQYPMCKVHTFPSFHQT